MRTIPEAWSAAYPQFGLVRSGLLAGFGAVEECVRCIDDVESRLSPVETDEARWWMARATSVRCFVACVQNDLSRAEQLADVAEVRELPLPVHAAKNP